MKTAALEPDRNQIDIFADALFRHAPEGYVSLRAFHHDNSVFRITPVRLNGKGLRFLCDAAEDDARRAAQAPKPAVFCPPVAVFVREDRAREEDLAAGLALSAELDERPYDALDQLEETIGPATIIVRSGGQWIDADGAAQDKLHAHWRLAVPATGTARARLKTARRLAVKLAGGDASNIPAVHPLRWPGSWHRKAEPRMCEIIRCDPDREIDLDEALAELAAASPAEENTERGNGADNTAGERADWAELIANIIAGRDLHLSINRLASSCAGRGYPQTAAADMLRGLLLQSPRDERWQTRFDDIGRSVRTAYEKFAEPEQPNGPDSEEGPDSAEWPWRFFGMQEDIVERAYLVDKLLPETGVALLAGQWGTYKTFTALDLAAAVITGTSFAGFDVTRRGAVLFVSLEGQGEVVISVSARRSNTTATPKRQRRSPGSTHARGCSTPVPERRSAPW